MNTKEPLRIPRNPKEIKRIHSKGKDPKLLKRTVEQYNSFLDLLLAVQDGKIIKSPKDEPLSCAEAPI